MHWPSLDFKPRLLTSLNGYTRDRFTRDVGAGLTVGVVALPLAMAFAIASGAQPEAGIFTAIIAGFLISRLGGSGCRSAARPAPSSSSSTASSQPRVGQPDDRDRDSGVHAVPAGDGHRAHGAADPLHPG